MNDVVQKIEKYFYIMRDTYRINADKTVDVFGNVDIARREVKNQLPIEFGTVTGTFDCTGVKLDSLKGAPHTVKNFHCYLTQLTTLQHAPKIVYGGFDCSDNLIISLQGSPATVKNFYCQNNRLTSLVGGPAVVQGYYDCRKNPLVSLEGLPQAVGEKLVLTYRESLGLLKLIVNDIKSLNIARAPLIVQDIMEKYRAKANSVSTPEQRNAVAVQCAMELIRAGYKNNARI